MIVLGLTGSIGMGKSTTAEMFREVGVPVFDADAEVHALQKTGGAAVEPIKKIFPTAIVDGAVDRKKLADLVLTDAKALQRLEAILHPMVKDAQLAFLKTATENFDPLVVLDIPLLFEKGGAEACDYIVVVSAPEEIQKARVLERPGMTIEKFESILKMQTPDNEKAEKADFVIDTGASKKAAKNQVETLINTLKQRSENA